MSEEIIAQPQADVESQVMDTVENTTQQTETQAYTPPATIKVKYNHNEMDIPYEEAVQHIQKGMNYEKAIEKAQQTARDAYIAEQGFTWMDKPITTEAQYKQALKEQETFEKLQQQALPEEVISEILESRREREERQTEKQRQQEEQAKQAEYKEFFEMFPDVDPNKDIAQATWEQVSKGVPLKYAFQNQRYKEMEAKFNALNVNQTNAATSSGSVSAPASISSDTISFETFEANKHDKNWVMKNFNRINKSRAKW